MRWESGGSMLYVIRHSGIELGVLRWEFEGRDIRVRVEFNCQHQIEFYCVSWLLKLWVSSANYPEFEDGWNWRDFRHSTEGLKYRASWLVCYNGCMKLTLVEKRPEDTDVTSFFFKSTE